MQSLNLDWRAIGFVRGNVNTRHAIGVLPPPLRGRVGEGGRSYCASGISQRPPPRTPTPIRVEMLWRGQNRPLRSRSDHSLHQVVHLLELGVGLAAIDAGGDHGVALVVLERALVDDVIAGGELGLDLVGVLARRL